MALASLKESFSFCENFMFPGLALHRAEAPMGLETSSILDKQFGSPLCPLIIPGKKWVSKEAPPSTEELLCKQSSLLRKVTAPEIKRNGSSLLERFQNLLQNGESALKKTTLDCLWPEATTWSAPKGRNYFKISALCEYRGVKGGEGVWVGVYCVCVFFAVIIPYFISIGFYHTDNVNWRFLVQNISLKSRASFARWFHPF